MISQPYISIILPIRNESNFISNTLDSIINQEYPMDNLEIIIADGMSDDGTREILHIYQKKYSNIKLVDNPERIVPTGFNRALNQAKGDIIIRIDGHSEVDLDFVENRIRLLEEKDSDCVGGATEHIADNAVGQAVKTAQSSKFGVGGVAFREDATEGKYVDTLAFGVYKREVFEKIGGYDEELVRNQDDEFNFRLIQNGGKIWLDPSIKSVYYPRNSLKKLFKQYFQYGFYKVRVMQKRRAFASWRHLVPGVFVLALFVSVLTFPISHFPFYLILGSYLTANLSATIWEIFKLVTRYKSQTTNHQLLVTSHQSPVTTHHSPIANHQSPITAVLLPITFFTLHFSYGLGFLCGLVIFWNKWNDREVKDHHFDRDQFINRSETQNY